jgi:hypothetical protein
MIYIYCYSFLSAQADMAHLKILLSFWVYDLLPCTAAYEDITLQENPNYEFPNHTNDPFR